MSTRKSGRPEIFDGTEPPAHYTFGLHLTVETIVRIGIQTEEDGSYRTSVLSIGDLLPRIDIFGGRAELERLHRLLGQHLEQLYAYQLERDGLAADVPDEVKRAAMRSATDRAITEAAGDAALRDESDRREADASEEGSELKNGEEAQA